MIPHGTPVLEAIESFYSDSVDSVARRLAEKLHQLQRRESSLEETLDELGCDEFLELYLNQTQAIPLGDWIERLTLRPGQLRTSIVGRELATTTAARRRSLILDGEHMALDHLPLAGLPPEQVKATLCYAHDVVIEDPFDEEQVQRNSLT